MNMMNPIQAETSTNTKIPAIEGIDHLHLYVENKDEAAKWYRQVFGFEHYKPLDRWNTAQGPMVLTGENLGVHLALFTRSQQAPSSAFAFKTSKQGFQQWLEHLKELSIDVRVSDHQVTESLYFSDPDGNYHEITYYKENESFNNKEDA